MAPFTILPDAQEDELHGQRLLRIEERPFDRIKSRLLGPSTPFHTYLTYETASSPTGTTNGNDSADVEGTETKENRSEPFSPEQHAKFMKDLRRFREDVILDFAVFEASIARIQFLRDANERERQRYAAEKVKIEATAEEVRNDTARLKIRLEESKRTLEIRKGYDILAETITKDFRLKPRDEQDANIERLKLEIEELKSEGVELESSWVERRDQFARVVEEGQRLRRIVRDEKETEQEVKGDGEGDADGDDGNDSDGNENMLGVERHRDDGSNVGTPRPGMGDDEVTTPLPGSAMTPRSIMDDAEGQTPRPDVTDGAGGHERRVELGEDTNMHEVDSGDQGQGTLPQVKIGDEMDTS